tara:strand:+ start:36 stop:503 length:468 start_codon:yes stop_codon:yes gene_type:complete
MELTYSIIVKSNHWPRRFPKIKRIISKIFSYKKNFDFNPKGKYNCNIVLTNDSFIKKYNKIYKKNNKSTDVLTFVSKIKKNSVIENHCDIILSADTAIHDAKKNNIDFYDHFAHLIIHSILHINGYSHNNNKNYLKMKSKEIYILNRLGISNPYL